MSTLSCIRWPIFWRESPRENRLNPISAMLTGRNWCWTRCCNRRENRSGLRFQRDKKGIMNSVARAPLRVAAKRNRELLYENQHESASLDDERHDRTFSHSGEDQADRVRRRGGAGGRRRRCS